MFPKHKSHLRGTQYGSKEGVIEAVNKYLRGQENAFYFEEILKRTKMGFKGDYIEKIVHGHGGRHHAPPYGSLGVVYYCLLDKPN